MCPIKYGETISFEEKGYPSIKILESQFEIKSIDYSVFREFKYSDVDTITLKNPWDSFWGKMYISHSFFAKIFAKEDPWTLIISKKNGGEWKYETSAKYNDDFRKMLKIIRSKI